jgi:hypothetical protein
VRGGGGLEGAYDGGADGDDGLFGGAGLGDGAGGGGGDLVALGVEPLTVELTVAERGEGAGADVQRDRRATDAARLQRREELGGEVQAGGRRGDGAGGAREDGLVALAVGVVGRRALDVGRQRDLAVALGVGDDVAAEADVDPLAVDGEDVGGSLPARVSGPGRMGLEAPPMQRQRLGSPAIGSTRRSSTAPPVGLTAARRARSTRVSLTTTRAPSGSNDGRSRTWRCSAAPVARSRT